MWTDFSRIAAKRALLRALSISCNLGDARWDSPLLGWQRAPNHMGECVKTRSNQSLPSSTMLKRQISCVKSDSPAQKKRHNHNTENSWYMETCPLFPREKYEKNFVQKSALRGNVRTLSVPAKFAENTPRNSAEIHGKGTWITIFGTCANFTPKGWIKQKILSEHSCAIWTGVRSVGQPPQWRMDGAFIYL